MERGAGERRRVCWWVPQRSMVLSEGSGSSGPGSSNSSDPAGLGSTQPGDPEGCLFLSMASQAHGPYLLPQLGPELFGHPS